MENTTNQRIQKRAWLSSHSGEPLYTGNLTLKLDATHAAYGRSGGNLVLLFTGDQTKTRKFAAAENRHMRKQKPNTAGHLYYTRSGTTLSEQPAWSTKTTVARVRVQPIVWTEATPSHELHYQNHTLVEGLTLAEAQHAVLLLSIGQWTLGYDSAAKIAPKPSFRDTSAYYQEHNQWLRPKLEGVTIHQYWHGLVDQIQPNGSCKPVHHKTAPQVVPQTLTWDNYIAKLKQNAYGRRVHETLDTLRTIAEAGVNSLWTMVDYQQFCSPVGHQHLATLNHPSN